MAGELERRLVEAFETNGVGVVPAVVLPEGCEPATSDLVFVRTADGGCEVYLSSEVRYVGGDAEVAHMVSGPVVADTGRLLVLSDRGIRPAIRDIISLLGPPSREPARAHTDMAGLEECLARGAKPPSQEDVLGILAARVFGQDNAVSAVAAAVALKLARRRHVRPLSLLLVGPTGSGKTETARALADLLGDAGEHLGFGFVRVNLNEYREAHTVSRLLGAPPGYVGSQDGGVLRNAFATSPRQVVLFDELDKAHEDILLCIMAAMDAGEFASSPRQGTPLRCAESIFLFTSNLCSDQFAALAGSSDCDADASSMDVACRRLLEERGMRPELVGRFSSVVPYAALASDARARVVLASIDELASAYGVSVSFVEPSVVATILGGTHRDAPSGARLLGYRVERELGPALLAFAERDLGTPATITGPPFACQPLSHLDAPSAPEQPATQPRLVPATGESP